MAVPLYIAAIGAEMLACAIWSFRRGSFVGCAACLLMAALCAYALMLSPAHSEPAKTPIARCTSFLRVFVLPLHGALKYSLIDASQVGDPPTVTIEFETRNKLRAPGRSIGSCEFDRDRRHINFFGLDGQRAQIIYD